MGRLRAALFCCATELRIGFANPTKGGPAPRPADSPRDIFETKAKAKRSSGISGDLSLFRRLELQRYSLTHACLANLERSEV